MTEANKIQIFQSADGSVHLDVRLDRETVWLRQEQMSELFGRERSVITKHLRNIFAERELDENSVRANFAHTAEDGKTYQVSHYNLDVVAGLNGAGIECLLQQRGTVKGGYHHTDERRL